MAAAHQRGQRVEAVRHIGRIFETLQGFAGPYRVCRVSGRQAQLRQSQAGQGPLATGDGVRLVNAVCLVGFKRPLPVCDQRLRQLRTHGFAHGVNALRVDHIQLFGNVSLRRQCEHQFLERSVQLGVSQNTAHGRNIGIV